MLSDQISFLLGKLPYLLIGFPGERPGGLLMSVALALAGIGLGFGLALVFGSLAAARQRPLRWLNRLYVEVFRGLPLILLLLIIDQGVGGRRFGLALTPRQSAVIALALYSGAYQAEILRAGLQAVPVSLVESARLMGARPWQVYLFIRLRYALRVMAPAFTGQAISLFKDTSVVIIIGVSDLMTVARSVLGSDVANTTYWLGLYALVGFLYFCVAFALSQWSQRWERRRQPDQLVHTLADYAA